MLRKAGPQVRLASSARPRSKCSSSWPLTRHRIMPLGPDATLVGSSMAPYRPVLVPEAPRAAGPPPLLAAQARINVGEPGDGRRPRLFWHVLMHRVGYRSNLLPNLLGTPSLKPHWKRKSDACGPRRAKWTAARLIALASFRLMWAVTVFMVLLRSGGRAKHPSPVGRNPYTQTLNNQG